MHIALVAAMGGDLVKSTEHIGISCIAAYLRENGYKVSIMEITELESKKTDEFLNNDYDLVGFSTTCVNLKFALDLAKMVKEKNNSVYTMCGGHMATFSGKEILEKWDFIDFIITGEGEITFLELVQALDNNKPLEPIKGLLFRNEQGEVITNESRELIEDLDMLPFPARDQFEEHNENLQYIRICSSRGCYGNCGFCSSFVGREQKGKRWRGRSPKNVVDEIELLSKKYNHHTFDFVDSTFEDPGKKGKERISQIAQEILSRNLEIYYNCCFRAENWTDDDREVLSLLIESGLEKVNIGFESGNDRGLEILNKNARMKHNWRVIKLLADFPDIYITFGFIMFHPYSCMDDLKDNSKFLYGTGIGQVIRHYFWQLEVYPGTLMEEKLIRDKLLLKNYCVEDGMYLYRFESPEMNHIVERTREMLKVQSVWDFEIFDIIIHTFITRLRRKYKNDEVITEIEEFASYVKGVRAEMAKFNYDFFAKLISTEDYNVEEEADRLNKYILKNMKTIENEQFKLGHNLLKQGIKLINR